LVILVSRVPRKNLKKELGNRRELIQHQSTSLPPVVQEQRKRRELWDNRIEKMLTLFQGVFTIIPKIRELSFQMNIEYILVTTVP